MARKVGVAVDCSSTGVVGAGDDGVSGSRDDDELGTGVGVGELSAGRDGLGCSVGEDGVSDGGAVLGEGEATGVAEVVGVGEAAGVAEVVEETVGSVGEGIVVQAERRTHTRQRTSSTLRVFPFINSLLLP